MFVSIGLVAAVSLFLRLWGCIVVISLMPGGAD